MYSDGPRAQPSIGHASSNVPGEDQGQPDHAPYPTSAEFQAQPPQGDPASDTYEQIQGHPGYDPYLGFTAYQTQPINQNAAFNMPGQSTLELGVHSQPTYGSISQEPSQHIMGQSMHNSASAIYSQHQPPHFSQSIQPSNATMPFNDMLDIDRMDTFSQTNSKHLTLTLLIFRRLYHLHHQTTQSHAYKTRRRR